MHPLKSVIAVTMHSMHGFYHENDFHIQRRQPVWTVQARLLNIEPIRRVVRRIRKTENEAIRDNS